MNKVCSLSFIFVMYVCFFFFFTLGFYQLITWIRCVPSTDRCCYCFKVFFNWQTLHKTIFYLDMKKSTIILEWISFQNQRKINLILVVKLIFLKKYLVRFFSTKTGQDVLPLTFKLFPAQRSESVDNGNRASPTNNGLQRVCNLFFHF